MAHWQAVTAAVVTFNLATADWDHRTESQRHGPRSTTDCPRVMANGHGDRVVSPGRAFLSPSLPQARPALSDWHCD